MDKFLLSQVLVGLAIGFDLVSFQMKSRQGILRCLVFAGCLIAAHFYLLERWTAAVLMTIAVVRYGVSYYLPGRGAGAIFVLISLAASALTFQGLLTLFSTLGSVFQTLGAFCREDRSLRLFMIAGTTIWLIHNILAHSPMAVVMEILFLGSNILGYVRFYKKSPSGR